MLQMKLNEKQAKFINEYYGFNYKKGDIICIVQARNCHKTNLINKLMELKNEERTRKDQINVQIN